MYKVEENVNAKLWAWLMCVLIMVDILLLITVLKAVVREW